ncbi:hypothetical protein BLA15945_02531 [Burkholderia lata]|uniref:Uncharacterized protein n=2 Tax=Burkholderia lata (strain ATCC 17760 / DSM 23089 / LMG 22485 / NCIMB 9086 / R18194 / 383) TaxID=482957 RepID=A0A6P2KFD4_BURL3|nr:hypothetical protein BLA15945_02531 [Burkholderia lata]
MSAIDARHARDFARRPQDLIELCDDWRTHGEIRAHFDQVKSHVHAQLAARPDRREKAELSIDKALDGAQRLALAIILGRRLTIRYSAGADLDASGDPPIDPRLLLRGWNANEISALLERPLFSEGGYGRVRLHHRSVMEYLAARQIDVLVESGAISISAAKRLIFGLTGTNERILKPSMRAVAGWLALLRHDMFDAVLAVEPSTLLTYGDPESLSDLQRERALLAFVQRYGKGQWRGLEVPYLQVTRLAKASLSDTVLAAWRTNVENPEVRELLLKLVSAGRLERCADLVFAVAMDTKCTDSERFEALVALATINDGRFGPLINAAVESGSGNDWSGQVVQWIATVLYPKHVSDAQLIQILARVSPRKRRSDNFTSNVARIIESAELDTARLNALLPAVASMARENFEENDDLQIVLRSGRLDVSKILHALCTRLIEREIWTREIVEASVMALRTGDADTDVRLGKDNLRSLLDTLPATLRRQVFEADYAWLSKFETKPNAQFRNGRLLFRGVLSYDRERDWHWALGALEELSHSADLRAALLHLLVRFAATGPDSDAELDAIRKAVLDSPILTGQWSESVKSLKSNDAAIRMQEEHRKREERQRQKIASQRGEWLEFWNELATRPALALAPARVQTTMWNLSVALRKRESGNQELRWDRTFLERHFGKKSTDAIRRALTSYWRSMTPSIRSERKPDERNTYLVVWSIGRMGIYAEAEDPAWAMMLNDSDADLAARYALTELNGFPQWTADLATSHGAQVESIIGSEVDDDLAAIDGASGWHSMVLQGLLYGPMELAELMQPRLARWIAGPGSQLMQCPHDANNERKLDQVVSILVAHGDPSVRKTLEDLAVAQLDIAGHGPFLFFWLPVLCALNPERGVDRLLHGLEHMPVQRDGVAIKAIGSIFNERRTKGVKDWRSTLTADSLLKLTVAIYQHVQPEEDAEHEGAYTPDSRDYAENGRRYVFEALMQATGPEAMRAKLALAAHPLFARLQDRIAALAQERLASELDTGSVEVSELARMFEGKELPPKTGTDMAQLLIDRLDDLQELMLRDTGPRAAWAVVADENTLRPAIARELEVSARNAYTVDQEAVTVDGKETDIRLRSVSGHQATIELKIGEKPRSAKELRDTVEDQLVTKYMAHKLARTGCLLVTVADPKKRWQHPDTKARIDRIQLQELLEEAAREAQLRLGGDARVVARILDLTPRLESEAKMAAKAAPRKKRSPATRGSATSSSSRPSTRAKRQKSS